MTLNILIILSGGETLSSPERQIRFKAPLFKESKPKFALLSLQKAHAEKIFASSHQQVSSGKEEGKKEKKKEKKK